MNTQDTINNTDTLAILRVAGEHTTQRDIASSIGYSVGKVNYILKALIQKGLIKIENFSHSTNKKAYRYLLTEQGFKEKIALTEKFIERKKQEYEELQRELEVMKSCN
ncbi:MAG: MarR family EPS-associated transcriptional regulator [Sulfurospirillaceae bacterium]|nr:MarR family EPS-associated transcriptional regulator [Sulfurospirillaceae bacterium]